MPTKYISNSNHYKEVLSHVKDVKSTLWIGTADANNIVLTQLQIYKDEKENNLS